MILQKVEWCLNKKVSAPFSPWGDGDFLLMYIKW
jgi:hypothetical protein